MSSRPGADSAVIEDRALLFGALLDQGGLAVAVVDATGRVTMMSRGLQELVGASVGGPAASNCPRLLHLFDAEGAAVLDPDEVPLARAARGETVEDVVISVRRPGEPVRYLRCNATPLNGPDGQRAGAIVVVDDVTAEHSAVRRQDTIRGLLLDTVNHELRTPLTVVLANAELIVDAAHDLPEHLRGPLSAIVRASGRLRDTVQHVSDLVDLEEVAHAVRSTARVYELVTAVADRYRDQATERNVSVDVDCPGSLHWNLDAALVKRAVAALLDNALVHGPGDNEVTVAAEVVDDQLRVCVIDRGHGIPVHDQGRLTKPFERGSMTAVGARHSRGLGLPLAQAVATSHHGALVLENHRPRGFTACLVLA